LRDVLLIEKDRVSLERRRGRISGDEPVAEVGRGAGISISVGDKVSGKFWWKFEMLTIDGLGSEDWEGQ
jgi:hypothetical protein